MRISPPNPNPKFAALWEKMVPGARVEFAKLVRTSSGSLRQYAEGRRSITPKLAIRIEKAVEKLGLKPINRMDLNETCRNCEYAIACRKQKRGK